MSWLEADTHEPGVPVEPRPIVIVEDHLKPLEKIIAILAKEAGHFLDFMTVVSLAKDPGADSRASVRRWLERHPQLQAAACLAREDAGELVGSYPGRLISIESEALESNSSEKLCGLIAHLLRPRGLLLQDICLDSVAFVPHGEMIESYTKVANSVCNRFPKGHRPECWLMSEQKSFEADFMLNLERKGFDPKNFLNKRSFEMDLAKSLRAFLVKSMPLFLRVKQRGEEVLETIVGPEDRQDIMSGLDLVLWQPGGRIRVGGRLVKPEEAEKRRKGDGKISRAWEALVGDLFGGSEGVSIDRFSEIRGDGQGSRLAYDIREMFNVSDASFVLETVNRSYRINDKYRVGWVTESPFLS